MKQEIEFRFEDGVSLTAGVEGGQTVLDAALAAGINLVHQCRSGSCSSCICTVVQGESDAVEGRATSLLKGEFASGMRLSCSIYATTPLMVELPYPYALTQGAVASESHATVDLIQRVSSSVWILGLSLSTPMDFVPGQYLRLRVPGTDAWRSYSLASQPEDLPRVQLMIKHHDRGLMSGALLELSIGDSLDVLAPFGSFTLRKHSGDFLLLAGGTGLGPVLAILDRLRDIPGKRPRIQMTFTCSYQDELFFLDELDLRSQWMPNLQLTYGVSRPEEGYSGHKGNPISLVDFEQVGPQTMVFVCGSPGLVAAAREQCSMRGVDPRNIISEQYLPEVLGESA